MVLAADRYKLEDPVNVPLSRWQKFVGFLDASQGATPRSWFAASEVQVIDSGTGEVAFSAVFRYEAPLVAMQEQIRTDLSRLTVAQFEEEYGITHDSGTPRVRAGEPSGTYFDSSAGRLASGMARGTGFLMGWVRSLVGRRPSSGNEQDS